MKHMASESKIVQLEKSLINLRSEIDEMRYSLRNLVRSMFVVLLGIAVLTVLFKI